MQQKIQIEKNGDLTAPNVFTISVHPNFTNDVQSNQSLLNNLALILKEAGLHNDIKFTDDPSINVFPDIEILEGEFKVRALMKDQSLAETREQSILGANTKKGIPPKAFLIVGGSKIFTLEFEVVDIGRKLENTLVLDDPRVSRHHAQLRAIRGNFMLFDLDSSGGTFVNGERINQILLHPGDVISLAGVPMVYGQDAVRAISESQEYVPPRQPEENTTALLEIKDLDLDNFQD
jgi:hypothetical protein